MKKIKIIALSALAFVTIASTVFVSCQKQSKEVSEVVSTTKNIKKRSTNEGIMKFNSIDELQSYYNYLNELVKNRGEKSISDVLLSEEQKNNFISLRSNLDIDEATIDYFEGEITNPNKSNYVLDEIRQSILNPNYEVKIADDIYIYFNTDIILKVKENNTTALEVIRKEIKNNRQSGLPNCFNAIEFDVISNSYSHNILKNITMSPEKFELLKKTRGEAVTSEKITLDVENFKCNIYDRKFIFKKLVLDIIGDNNGTVYNYYKKVDPSSMSIDFGDNTSSPISLPSPEVTHTYSGNGVYTAKITVNYIDPTNNAYTTTTKNVDININAGCSDDNRSIDTWKSNGNICLEGEIWMNKDMFGQHAGSKTNSYKWLNGKWRKRNGDVTTKINAKYRDTNCTEIASKNESDHCNCRDVRAVVTYGGRHNYANGDIYSHHTLENTISLDLVLDPCQ